MSNLIGRRAAAGLATAGALLLGALAAAPQAGAQPVYVCQKVGGTFHVVSSKQHCKKGEGKLSLGVSEAGAMGVVGATGPAGVTGSVGAAGPAGPAGPEGKEGPAGKSGAAAAQGEKGAAGVAGATGPTGATGAAGATGPTGATGAVGTVGTVETVATKSEIAATAEGAETNAHVTVISPACPSGSQLISGGFWTEKVGVEMLVSRRTASSTWEYTAENTSSLPSKVEAYGYCLKNK
jgi:hypothetical protein